MSYYELDIVFQSDGAETDEIKPIEEILKEIEHEELCSNTQA